MNKFKDGIFALNTRQFGTVVELLIKLIENYHKSGDLSYDLYKNGVKIEVKGSRVYKKNKLSFTLDNLYEMIVSNSNKNRLIKSEDLALYDFDCNIQQIKPTHFDFMFYILFFFDIIEIFKIRNDVILSDKEIFYSNKQHRGNIGEGQFHINNKTYSVHKKKYFYKSFTYEEIKKILLKRKKEEEQKTKNQTRKAT